MKKREEGKNNNNNKKTEIQKTKTKKIDERPLVTLL